MSDHVQSASDFERSLRGYRLTTAEILYGLPDHPRIEQMYIWQELDLYPEFPILHKFLKFWKEKLEGPLRRVRVAHCGLVCPIDLKHYKHELTMQ